MRRHPKPTGATARRPKSGPMLAADGTPLKAVSTGRSGAETARAGADRAAAGLRPVTFIAPIADMLFRSVENQIVSETLPRTTVSELSRLGYDQRRGARRRGVRALASTFSWRRSARIHTRLGSRLNYEQPASPRCFAGRVANIDDVGDGLSRPVRGSRRERWDRAREPLGRLVGTPRITFPQARAWRDETRSRSPSPELMAPIRLGLCRVAAFARAIVEFQPNTNRVEEDPWASALSTRRFDH